MSCYVQERAQADILQMSVLTWLSWMNHLYFELNFIGMFLWGPSSKEASIVSDNSLVPTVNKPSSEIMMK